jgi:hypothetical protein
LKFGIRAWKGLNEIVNYTIIGCAIFENYGFENRGLYIKLKKVCGTEREFVIDFVDIYAIIGIQN